MKRYYNICCTFNDNLYSLYATTWDKTKTSLMFGTYAMLLFVF